MASLQDPRSKIQELSTPAHVALILDGNRRWAKNRGKKPLEGHEEGSEVFRRLSLHLFDQGVSCVTAFVFSTENWKRTEEEVSYLMKLVARAVEKHLDEFHAANVRIRIIGERDGLSKSVLQAIERSEEKTANNTRGTMYLAFNYGGKQEIASAIKNALADGLAGEDIDQKTLLDYTYAPEMPPVDLMIRTSGENRTSGFLTLQSDYAELYFTDTLWPDMDEAAIDAALNDYANRQRRFGE